MAIDSPRLLLKVLLQDLAAIGVYWVVTCALGRLADIAPVWIPFMLTGLLWLVLAALLFFSHGELLRWVRNDRAWALANGLLTLALMLPVVWLSLDNPCPWADIQYGRG